MKNYLVKAIITFNDTAEKNEAGGDTQRIANQSIWNCTKERYEFLKSKNAVILVGIDKVEDQKPETVKKNKKSKKTLD